MVLATIFWMYISYIVKIYYADMSKSVEFDNVVFGDLINDEINLFDSCKICARRTKDNERINIKSS